MSTVKLFFVVVCKKNFDSVTENNMEGSKCVCVPRSTLVGFILSRLWSVCGPFSCFGEHFDIE